MSCTGDVIARYALREIGTHCVNLCKHPDPQVCPPEFKDQTTRQSLATLNTQQIRTNGRLRGGSMLHLPQDLGRPAPMQGRRPVLPRVCYIVLQTESGVSGRLRNYALLGESGEEQDCRRFDQQVLLCVYESCVGLPMARQAGGAPPSSGAVWLCSGRVPRL
eukprot:1380630-Rhodomonas_salina.1